MNDVVVTSTGGLLASTDLGVVYRAPQKGWARLGTNLPTTAVLDLQSGPDGNMYVATHGRGIWRTPAGGL